MRRCSVVSAVPVPGRSAHGQRSTEPSRRAARRVAAFGAPALALAAVASLAAGAGAAHAADSLGLTTPYPTVETQAGSTVKVDLDVTSAAVEPVDLTVGDLPDGWQATLRGGGFVIHSITTTPDKPTVASLELVVDPSTPAGEHPVTITATDPTGGTVATTLTLDVVDEVNAGIGLVADFPSLSGDPGSAFTYSLTITNNTPAEQVFTFDPTAPQGWTVSASPTAEAKAQTVTIEAGGTSDVKVTATPPATAEQGKYPINVAVTAANGATGTINLEAEVTGTPTMAMSTADQRLDAKGKSDTEERIPLIVGNTGTAPLEDVKLAGTAPTGWDVSFDPETIASVKPNETAQVVAIVKPSSDAVAGDYALAVRASAGSQSSNLDLRYTLEGSRTLGFIAIVVIIAAVGALAGVFVKFGRR